MHPSDEQADIAEDNSATDTRHYTIVMRYFFSVLFIGIVMLGLLQAQLPDIQIFADQDLRRLKEFEILPMDDQAAMKIDYAKNRDTFEIGLFGNSRIIEVSHKDLGGSEGRFFNFAIGGSSFSNSVRMLESLASAGRMPGVAVISFDHPAMQLRWHAPVVNGAATRVLDAVSELWRALRHYETASLKLAIDYFFSRIMHEWEAVKGTFSFERLRVKLHFRLPDFVPYSHSGLGMRVDGSRMVKPTTEWKPVELNPDGGTPPPNFVRDMKRLSVLRGNESRIIVYISPISPFISDERVANLTGIYADQLRQLKGACSTFEFECYDSPKLGDNITSPPYWSDASHAPSPLLGAFIRSLIDEDGQGSRFIGN